MTLFGYKSAAQVIVCSGLALMLGGMAMASDAAAQQQEDSEQNINSTELRGDGRTSGALYVPVFPIDSFSGEKPEKNTKESVPVFQSLGNSYILLEDGSALSMSDWILGGLKKNQGGVGMGDYESRLFLGQVARALVGESEDLTHQSLIYTAPTVRYQMPPPPKGFEAVWKSMAGLVVSAILPGTPDNWDHTKTGNSFSPSMISGDGAAILFQNQFHGAVMQSAGDFKEQGIYQNMLDAERKRLETQQ